MRGAPWPRERLTASRRISASLSLAAMVSLGVVTLYQVGAIPHLPDPPLPGFDADKVHGSQEAYLFWDLPDGVLGVGSYAVTLALITIGGEDRAARRPWLPLALAAKVAFDVAQAARLTAVAVTRLHALSAWSLLVSSATAATAPLVIPEARNAVRSLHEHHVAGGMDVAIGRT